MKIRRTNKRYFWYQLGQTMAEYIVVMAALVGGLLVANKGACPREYDNCVEYLLTVMHDDYNGYSASISAVQDYDNYDVTENDHHQQSSSNSSGSSSSQSPPSGANPSVPNNPVSKSTVITSEDGSQIYGTYDASSGLVTKGEQIVGSYDAGSKTFTPTEGEAAAGRTADVVTDSDNNILRRKAVTNCGAGDDEKVLGFGYQSKAKNDEDKGFFDSLQFNKLDIGNNCIEPAYKVDSGTDRKDDGRIVGGYYYAVTLTPALHPMAPNGEVIYWKDVDAGKGMCAVMATGWDSNIDSDDSAEDQYQARLDLLNESDPKKTPLVGTLDQQDYKKQTGIDAGGANSCPSHRTIEKP